MTLPETKLTSLVTSIPSAKILCPPSFTSPDEASSYLHVIGTEIYDFFEDLWRHTYCILSKQRDLHNLSIDQQSCLIQSASRTVDLNDDLANRNERCRQSLRAWLVAFSATQQTKENIISHVSTQISFFCIYVWIEMWRETDAMDVDRFESQFKYFADVCEHYLNLHLAKQPFRSTCTTNQIKDSAHSDTPLAFALGSGAVPCLVAILERCRNSVIRQRCITMLQYINRREFFNTDYLVTYLKAIVKSEEKMARDCSSRLDLGPKLQGSDLSEAARIVDVVMSPS